MISEMRRAIVCEWEAINNEGLDFEKKWNAIKRRYQLVQFMTRRCFIWRGC